MKISEILTQQSLQTLICSLEDFRARASLSPENDLGQQMNEVLCSLNGHYEIRCCNASLHAGEVRAQIVLALAISNAAMTKKYCSPSVSHSDNMRYSFRVWLLGLGLIGDEFKNCRTHLLKHLTGNIAWRHPEDAIAQRERLKQERIAAREQAQQNESPCNERVATVCDDRQDIGETPDETINVTQSNCDDSEETEEMCMMM